MDVKTRTLKQFFHYFCHDSKEKQFCFILGAGASIQSGIRGGYELAKCWLKETEDIDKDDYNKWIKEETIDVQNPGYHYSQIFDKRFETDIHTGYKFLRDEMERKEPSCGYAILSKILATTHSNVVITPNFDCLMEDAMFIYSIKRPIVIGHEYLAEFIHASPTQPIIVKIHRDLYLAPKNSTNDTRKLNESIRNQLSHILRNYTPIVIGYGGNDGSLIGFLDELKPQDINGGMFWCSVPPEVLHDRVKRVINKFQGFEIKMDGFDEFMIQLGDEIGFSRLDETIMEIARKRVDTYQTQIENVKNKSTPSSNTNNALSHIIGRSKKDWLTYYYAAETKTDVDKKNHLYLKALELAPDNYRLLCYYARFLFREKKDFATAEEYYQKSIDIDPENPVTLGDYAIFLKLIRKNYDAAEENYKKALRLDPLNSVNAGNYAFFLETIRKNYDQAEKYYLQAIEADKTNDLNYLNFAYFLDIIKKQPQEAKKYYEISIQMNKRNVNNIGNYTKLLLELGELEEAKEYLKMAFEQNKEVNDKQLALEISFYAYAVFPQDYPSSETTIKTLLQEGIRSIGWDLNKILAIAKNNNHPHYTTLQQYAQQITQE